MSFIRINKMSREEQRSVFGICCGSTRWIEKMCASAPYTSNESIFATAAKAMADLGEADWLEAFSHHPKIGDIESLKKKFALTADLAMTEQAGAVDAGNEALLRFMQLNCAYEEKYGFIFIVCATGKSAGEMLEILEARMHHQREEEINIASLEQKKITKLRLEKLL